MGLDFFRRSVELLQQYARPGQRILNTIQTNGTLLDDEWGAFLKENDFLVGISIDGPRDIHDTYRVDKGGKPTFDKVIRGLDVLKRHGCRLERADDDSPGERRSEGTRVYRFLRDDLGAEFIQFIPIIERTTAEHARRSRTRAGATTSRDGRSIPRAAISSPIGRSRRSSTGAS